MDFVNKSKSLLLVLAALAVMPAQAQFKGVLDTPSLATNLAAHRPLNSVTAAGSRLLAAGQRGHIIYSDDFGSTWKQAHVPVSSDLTAISFSSERSAWAVGHEGVVLHSDDGGQNWHLLLNGDQAAAIMRDFYNKKAQSGDARAAALLPDIEKYFSTGADKPFLDVWFENEKNGFVVGAFNMIFRTGDGGKTWEPWFDRIDNPKRLHLYSIRGKGGRAYVVGEQGLVAYLDANAQRFVTIRSPYAGSFFGLLPTEVGLIVFGMRGNAYRIDDLGSNWTKLDTGVVGGLTGAANLGDDRVALVSTAGDILVGSSDKGRFERLKTTRSMLFSGVAFVPGNKSLASVGSAGASIVPLPLKP